MPGPAPWRSDPCCSMDENLIPAELTHRLHHPAGDWTQAIGSAPLADGCESMGLFQQEKMDVPSGVTAQKSPPGGLLSWVMARGGDDNMAADLLGALLDGVFDVGGRDQDDGALSGAGACHEYGFG